jgi:hypothetical protein
MNGAVIEQADVKHLMNHAREGDEYVFYLGVGVELEFCIC